MISYLLSAATLATITCVFVLGLNLQWGLTGELNLSYYAFIAIGAYVEGVIVLPRPVDPSTTYVLGLGAPFLVGVLGAILVSGAISAVIGYVALRRLRHDSFAIVTVAFAFITATVISQYAPLFNGVNGIFNIPQPFESILNLPPDLYDLFFLLLTGIFLVAVYWFMELLYRSAFGRTLRAIREDEIAAAAFGRDVFRAKLTAFVVGSMIAGLGGALVSPYITAFSPAGWAPAETFLLYAGVIVGGRGNNRGVIVGTLLALIVVPQVTLFMPPINGNPNVLPALRDIIIGLMIVIFLKFRPQGLIPEPKARDVVRAAAPPSAAKKS